MLKSWGGMHIGSIFKIPFHYVDSPICIWMFGRLRIKLEVEIVLVVTAGGDLLYVKFFCFVFLCVFGWVFCFL